MWMNLLPAVAGISVIPDMEHLPGLLVKARRRVLQKREQSDCRS